ncbi:uncharacterized protein LOC121398802 [Xenopus laevis]|uniref:Uncharacterized protein n=2 Tax=Xenopus laevis TaxID=8355 RepID=A0A974H206_XENLA|nr:uncharacterized protein LOC121398802 [Xenopus laevis]OCT61908.1 hypothetical protein XELAEV_18047940mg [Xenopus laevis]
MAGFERTEDHVRKYIDHFSLDNCALGNQGYNRILIQLFGFMGHGKSSLINSCLYVIDDGAYHMYAKASASHASVTYSRTAYPLTDTITIVDNRGCATFNAYETGEIYAQLGNFIPLNQKVQWTNDYGAMINRLEDSEMDPNFTDFTIPVFVYSVKKGLAEGEKKETKEFIENCRKMTGVYPIVVLTHKTSGDFIQAEKEFLLMGVEKVIKIENYTKEDHGRTQGRHKEILNLLYSVLEDVNFQMKYKRNPRKERVERKKFLLNFLHEREMNKRLEQNAYAKYEKLIN